MFDFIWYFKKALLGLHDKTSIIGLSYSNYCYGKSEEEYIYTSLIYA